MGGNAQGGTSAAGGSSSGMCGPPTGLIGSCKMGGAGCNEFFAPYTAALVASKCGTETVSSSPCPRDATTVGCCVRKAAAETVCAEGPAAPPAATVAAACTQSGGTWCPGG